MRPCGLLWRSGRDFYVRWCVLSPAAQSCGVWEAREGSGGGGWAGDPAMSKCSPPAHARQRSPLPSRLLFECIVVCTVFTRVFGGSAAVDGPWHAGPCLTTRTVSDAFMQMYWACCVYTCACECECECGCTRARVTACTPMPFLSTDMLSAVPRPSNARHGHSVCERQPRDRGNAGCSDRRTLSRCIRILGVPRETAETRVRCFVTVEVGLACVTGIACRFLVHCQRGPSRVWDWSGRKN